MQTLCWLRQQAKQGEAVAEQNRQIAAEQQREADRAFIDKLASGFGIDSDRIDELLEIAARRSKGQ